MTDTDAIPEVTSERPVVRDSSFVRLLADHVIVVDLGRDFEFAFIAVGNPIATIASVGRPDGEESQQRVTSRMELTETGRVRMPPFTALNAAMNTLGKLVAKGLVDPSALREGIEEMISDAPAPDADEEAR